MSSEHAHEGAGADLSSDSSKARSRWCRRLAVATAVVFALSAAFPVAAGFAPDTASFPSWWGVLDVVIAFGLALLAMAVSVLAQGQVTKQVEEASYRAYRILLHGILVLLVAFFLLDDRIVWINCLTGFAWRAWLLLYTLPAWLTLFLGGGNR